MKYRIRAMVSLLLALAATAQAQVFPGGRGREREHPQFQPFAAQGTIAGVGRGQIQMITATQQKWLVIVSPQASATS